MTTAYPFPRRRLGSTSVEVTALGFGAAALGNLFRAIADDTAQACLQAALDSGIAYIDTAPHYGQGLSERRLGQALGKSLFSRPPLTLFHQGRPRPDTGSAASGRD
ncbi:MAG: aldo/keto reductase [Asticcacaulis sp.]|nr:aldo/keto reductase [Asticcacaulis sp.]